MKENVLKIFSQTAKNKMMLQEDVPRTFNYLPEILKI